MCLIYDIFIFQFGVLSREQRGLNKGYSRYGLLYPNIRHQCSEVATPNPHDAQQLGKLLMKQKIFFHFQYIILLMDLRTQCEV